MLKSRKLLSLELVTLEDGATAPCQNGQRSQRREFDCGHSCSVFCKVVTDVLVILSQLARLLLGSRWDKMQPLVTTHLPCSSPSGTPASAPQGWRCLGHVLTIVFWLSRCFLKVC